MRYSPFDFKPTHRLLIEVDERGLQGRLTDLNHPDEQYDTLIDMDECHAKHNAIISLAKYFGMDSNALMSCVNLMHRLEHAHTLKPVDPAVFKIKEK